MLRDAFLLHIRRMLAIVRKELLVLFCNPISRMLLIVPPLMQIIVFGWAATMEVRNVDVAVLDHDEGPLSREIVRRLEGSPTFRHVFFLRGQQEVRPAIEQEKALFVMVFDAEFSRRAARGEPVTVQLLLDGRRSNAAQIAAYYVQVMLAEVAAQTPLGRQAALAGGIGLMISSLSSTQQQAFLGAFTVGVPCILLSGAVTPVINMPMFLQHGSQLNPIRHFTTLVQGAFLRDITFEAASVSLLKICAITVVCVCVAVWMFRRRV